MEDLRTAMNLVSRNSYLASLELKDSYFMIPIATSDRKYLRFSFRGLLYQFNCLPFGLCTAPREFTKLLKPVAHYLRSKGYLSVIYLDDILLIGNSPLECSENVRETREILEYLGLVLNLDKCKMLPSTQCKFLGFIIDTKSFTIRLPQEKIQKIIELANLFKNKERFTIRELAQFVGILVAACPAVRYGRLYTKLLEREKYLALQASGGKFDKYIKGMH